jgi:hypothetical protein
MPWHRGACQEQQDGASAVNAPARDDVDDGHRHAAHDGHRDDH